MAQVIFILLIVGVIIVAVKLARGSPAKELAARRVFAERLAVLGWRDEGPLGDKWPIRFSGTTNGIPWSLSASPGPEDCEDDIWWMTDAISLDSFRLVIGYKRFGSLDWVGQGGVQHYEEIDTAVDAIMSELGQTTEAAMRAGATDLTSQMQRIEKRAYQERPWLTIDDFVKAARDVSLGHSELQDVQAKAQDAQLIRSLLDPHVVRALDACKRLLNGTDPFFRIWLGAPNLRLQFATLIDDEAHRLEVMKQVVELGTAIAQSYHRVAARATA